MPQDRVYNSDQVEYFRITADVVDAETEHNWMREYELNFYQKGIADVTISSIDQKTPLDILFNIENDGTKARETGMQLSVFGLSYETISKVITVGTEVTLWVGYRSSSAIDMPLLFYGRLSNAEVIDNGQKNEVRLYVRASEMGSRSMMTTYDRNFTYQERITEMINFARSKIPYLNIATATAELAQLVLDEPSKGETEKLGVPDKTLLTDQVAGTLTTSRTILEELSSICGIFNIVPKISRGVLHLVRKGGDLMGTTPVGAYLGINMTSPPRRRMDNNKGPAGGLTAFQMYDIQMLLTPEIDLNSVVVSDVSRAINGKIEKRPLSLKVVKVTHTGSYSGQTWSTKVTGTIDSEKVLTEVPNNKSIAQEYYDPGEVSSINKTNLSNTV